MAKKKGGFKHEQPQPGADQPVTSYRAMGGALTLEEVRLSTSSVIRLTSPVGYMRQGKFQAQKLYKGPMGVVASLAA